MILHHFTRSEHLAAIAERGILPNADAKMAAGHWVVWLTEEESAEWLPGCNIMLTVRIPSRDRKLTRYMPWLRKQPRRDGQPDADNALPSMNHWWLYFGTIAPSKIVEGFGGSPK